VTHRQARFRDESMVGKIKVLGAARMFARAAIILSLVSGSASKCSAFSISGQVVHTRARVR